MSSPNISIPSFPSSSSSSLLPTSMLRSLLPPLKQSLDAHGASVSDAWLEDALMKLVQMRKIPALNAYINSSSAASSPSTIAVPPAPLLRSCHDELFLLLGQTNLIDIGVRRLPLHFHTLHKTTLSGLHLVQLLSIRDIAHSYTELKEQPQRSDHTWMMQLTDGVEVVQAFEKVHCPLLTAKEMKPGVKLMLRDVPIRRGLLMCDPGNIYLLGGDIPDAAAYYTDPALAAAAAATTGAISTSVASSSNGVRGGAVGMMSERKEDLEENKSNVVMPIPPTRTFPTAAPSSSNWIQSAANAPFVPSSSASIQPTAAASTSYPARASASNSLLAGPSTSAQPSVTTPSSATSTAALPLSFVPASSLNATASTSLPPINIWQQYARPAQSAPTSALNQQPTAVSSFQQPHAPFPAAAAVTSIAPPLQHQYQQQQYQQQPFPPRPPLPLPHPGPDDINAMDDEEALAVLDERERDAYSNGATNTRISPTPTIFTAADLISPFPQPRIEEDTLMTDVHASSSSLTTSSATSHPVIIPLHDEEEDAFPVSQSMPTLEQAPPISVYVSPIISNTTAAIPSPRIRSDVTMTAAAPTAIPPSSVMNSHAMSNANIESLLTPPNPSSASAAASALIDSTPPSSASSIPQLTPTTPANAVTTASTNQHTPTAVKKEPNAAGVLRTPTSAVRTSTPTSAPRSASSVASIFATPIAAATTSNANEASAAAVASKQSTSSTAKAAIPPATVTSSSSSSSTSTAATKKAPSTSSNPVVKSERRTQSGTLDSFLTARGNSTAVAADLTDDVMIIDDDEPMTRTPATAPASVPTTAVVATSSRASSASSATPSNSSSQQPRSAAAASPSTTPATTSASTATPAPSKKAVKHERKGSGDFLEDADPPPSRDSSTTPATTPTPSQAPLLPPMPLQPLLTQPGESSQNIDIVSISSFGEISRKAVEPVIVYIKSTSLVVPMADVKFPVHYEFPFHVTDASGTTQALLGEMMESFAGCSPEQYEQLTEEQQETINDKLQVFMDQKRWKIKMKIRPQSCLSQVKAKLKNPMFKWIDGQEPQIMQILPLDWRS